MYAPGELVKLTLEVPDIAGNRRPDGGVCHGRQRSLIFLHFGQDVGRYADRNTGKLFGNDLGDAPLVRIVHVTVDQANGHCLHSLFGQARQAGPKGGLVERPNNLSVGADPLFRLDRRFERRVHFVEDEDDGKS